MLLRLVIGLGLWTLLGCAGLASDPAPEAIPKPKVIQPEPEPVQDGDGGEDMVPQDPWEPAAGEVDSRGWPVPVRPSAPPPPSDLGTGAR